MDEFRVCGRGKTVASLKDETFGRVEFRRKESASLIAFKQSGDFFIENADRVASRNQNENGGEVDCSVRVGADGGFEQSLRGKVGKRFVPSEKAKNFHATPFLFRFFRGMKFADRQIHIEHRLSAFPPG